MEKVKIYDLPLRLFHVLFATLFTFSFVVGKFVDDESWLYAYHMISGMMLVILVGFRVIWGFVGSKYSRFSSFHFKISDLIGYFQSILSGHSKRFVGHNPASGFTALLMFMMTLVLGFSGLMMITKKYKYFFEEVHEIAASGFLLFVVMHIVGLLLHQFRHKDQIMLSIVNGTKEKFSNSEGIKSNYTFLGIILLLAFLYLSFNFHNRFDIKSGNLNFGDWSLHLVDIEDD